MLFKIPREVIYKLYIENIKIILFSNHTSSTRSREQYLRYSPLTVLCSV